MMLGITRNFGIPVFVALTLPMCVWAANKPPEVDTNGLHLVHHSNLRLVYQRPGVDFSKFDKVILVDAYVAFRKNWQRDQNESDPFKANKRDVEDIKKRVAKEFHKAFAAELKKKGIPVVGATDTGPAVLIVRPAIINLDVSAPDTIRCARRSSSAARSP